MNIVVPVSKCLILNKEGQVLLLKRSETAPRAALEWDLPGGIASDGESAYDCAVRETMEETDLDLHGAELFYTSTSVYPGDEDTHSLLFSFFKYWFDDTPDITLSYEHIEHTWVNVGDLADHLPYESHAKPIADMIKYDLTRH